MPVDQYQRGMEALANEAVIPPDARLISAIEVIDKGALQIALVVDSDKRLLGTITDGDIRRGLLRGLSFDDTVDQVMNRSPRTVPIGTPDDVILRLMRTLQIHQIPIVDAEGRVAGIEVLDHLLGAPREDSCVVLMAGGLGTRLRPLTETTPKPLLPIGGRPLIETIIRGFAAQGFTHFFVSVNYMADLFVSQLGDGSRFGVQIEYLRETERKGTAGALSLLPRRPSGTLIVMNADLLTSANFLQLLDFHRKHKAVATMCVREYSFQVPYGVIEANGHKLTRIIEKPEQKFFVNAGIYALESSVLDRIPSDRAYDMTSLFADVAAEGGETAVFPLREYWLDIGRVDDLQRAQMDFAEIFRG